MLLSDFRLKIDMEEIKIKLAGEEYQESLNYILQNSEHTTIFHTQEWNELLREEFNLQSKTFIAEKNGMPVGMYTVFIYPARSIIHTNRNSYWFKTINSSLRDLDSIYGGPLFTEADDFIIRKLVATGEKVAQKVEFTQICTPPDYPIDLIQKCGYKCKKHLTSIVKVNKSEEEIWNSFQEKRQNHVRRNVRKAIRNGVSIIMDDFSSIGTYYQMLTEVFEKANKKPYIPYSYYERVIKNLVPKNLAKFLIARYKGRAIAGAIFLCFKDTVYYWSGASFRKYNWLAPNDLIQWEFMKWAHRNWYKYYDLLGIDPLRLPNIARFKMGFGGELKEIYNARKYTRLGNLAKIFRHLGI